MGLSHKFHAEEVCANYTKGEPDPCAGLNCYRGQCFLKDDPRKIGEMIINFLTHGNCTCEDGWTGTSCDLCCMLPCENGAVCEIDGHDDKLFCSCPFEYTGPYCETLKPTTTTPLVEGEMWNEITISVVSVTLFIGVVLFLLAALVPYIMYKKRNLLILKILYRFKKFEDDDSRRYDVFLSYRTSNKINRDFVVYKLLKQIESWGLLACIDERDFIPGGAIPETIKIAIKESRRTILVLSPAYIEGAWPEFEVQCAVFESISKAHRIIPVIYEPIDSCKNISQTLKHILESITYIEWPQDKNDEKAQEEFWRRLKLSMPKKKTVTPLPLITVDTGKDDKKCVQSKPDDGNAFITDAKPGEYADEFLFPPGMIAKYSNTPAI